MTEPTAFRLMPAGEHGPQGTLCVTLLPDRDALGRRQWMAAIAWRDAPVSMPRIVFDAVVPGERQWDLHDTDPGDGACYALRLSRSVGSWQPDGWAAYVARSIAAGIYRLAVE